MLVDQPSSTFQTLRRVGGNRRERHHHGCIYSTSQSVMTNFQKLSLHTDTMRSLDLTSCYQESKLSFVPVPLSTSLGARLEPSDQWPRSRFSYTTTWERGYHPNMKSVMTLLSMHMVIIMILDNGGELRGYGCLRLTAFLIATLETQMFP